MPTLHTKVLYWASIWIDIDFRHWLPELLNTLTFRANPGSSFFKTVSYSRGKKSVVASHLVNQQRERRLVQRPSIGRPQVRHLTGQVMYQHNRIHPPPQGARPGVQLTPQDLGIPRQVLQAIKKQRLEGSSWSLFCTPCQVKNHEPLRPLGPPPACRSLQDLSIPRANPAEG